MKKGRLSNLYSNFTGEERFRLHLEALYRGDEAEGRHLLESCPRETCLMNEAGFAHRWKASKEIVGMLCSVLGPLLARLRTVESFREALPYVLKICTNEAVVSYLDDHQVGSKRAREAAGEMGDPPGWKERKGGDKEGKGPELDQEMQSLRSISKRLEEASGEAVGPLDELERELLEESLMIWTAFAHCCSDECGVEPEKLVKVWFEPMLSEIERLKDLSASTELNPEMLKDYEAAFKKMWNGIVGLH